MSQLFGYLTESVKHRSKAVLWVWSPVKGSTPRKSLFLMMVLKNGDTVGTISNKSLEDQLKRLSAKMMKNGYPVLFRIRDVDRSMLYKHKLLI